MKSTFSSVKYSSLSPGSSQFSNDPQVEDRDATFDFASAFDYSSRPGRKYDSAFTYRSDAVHLDVEDNDHLQPRKMSLWLLMTSHCLTLLSYLFLILTFPISYWLLVKNLGEFDRMVIFRLGKLVGVKGPGRFVTFPWLDRTRRLDVRASAFSVPPQQFITADGGIVEMGADIQFGVVDIVTMIKEVVDHQDILRSLGKTLLVKILVRKTVSQLERDKRSPENEITEAMNEQVRKWGIHVQNVHLSDVKVLKGPESGSNGAIGSIMKGLGMKGNEPKFPSPQEFLKAVNNNENSLEWSSVSPDLSENHVNMNLLQSLSAVNTLPPGANRVQLGPGIIAVPPASKENMENPSDWCKCLETILQSPEMTQLESEAVGLYKLEISETEHGRDQLFIEVNAIERRPKLVSQLTRAPDVSVSISSADLAAVLEGSLAPLQAYLTGRIAAEGDVRKLAFFDKLSKRGHRPGAMFSI